MYVSACLCGYVYGGIVACREQRGFQVPWNWSYKPPDLDAENRTAVLSKSSTHSLTLELFLQPPISISSVWMYSVGVCIHVCVIYSLDMAAI